MLLFTGHYEHAIDEKNRLSIPAAFRNKLKPDRDGKGFYVVPGSPGALWLYPEKHFEELAGQYENRLKQKRSQLSFDRRLFPLAEFLEIDASGRVILPARHLQKVGIGREVTLFGVRNHIEIMNRSDFDKIKEDAWNTYSSLLIDEDEPGDDGLGKNEADDNGPEGENGGNPAHRRL